MNEQFKKFTWAELKEFCNSLDEKQLEAEVTIATDDEVNRVNGVELAEHDFYVYDDDYENCGTLDELKSYNDGFDPDLCELATPKGTPFLF